MLGVPSEAEKCRRCQQHILEVQIDVPVYQHLDIECVADKGEYKR
jgi:hypothetical protein